MNQKKTLLTITLLLVEEVWPALGTEKHVHISFPSGLVLCKVVSGEGVHRFLNFC